VARIRFAQESPPGETPISEAFFRRLGFPATWTPVRRRKRGKNEEPMALM